MWVCACVCVCVGVWGVHWCGHMCVWGVYVCLGENDRYREREREGEKEREGEMTNRSFLLHYRSQLVLTRELQLIPSPHPLILNRVLQLNYPNHLG